MNNKDFLSKIKIDLNSKALVFENPNHGLQKPKGIIYARVSTEEQVKHGFGIESQIENCLEWAKRNGVEVVKIFKDEGISGADLNRKGLQEALAFLLKQNAKGTNIKYFITTEASRISRSDELIDTLEIDKKIRSTGAEIIYTMHPIDTTTDEGKFIQNFQYLIAALERAKIKQRTINGIKAKLLQGYYPWPDVPLGYEAKYIHSGVKKQRILVLKHPEAQYLKEALEMFADGTFEHKKDIIDYLNLKGVRRNGKKLVKQLADRILTVKKLLFYAGYLVRPEQGLTQLIDGVHEPLIDIHLVQKILNRLQKKGKKHHKALFDTPNDEFVFRGYLFCPYCGHQLSAGTSINWQGKRYGYYYCFNKDCIAYKKSIRAEYVEECFKRYLEKIRVKDELWKVFKLILKDLWSEKTGFIRKQMLEKKNELEKIEAEIEDIEKKLLQISNPELVKRLEERWALLQEEKKLWEERLNDEKLFELEWKSLLKKAEMLFRYPLDLWNTGDKQLQKLILKLLGGQIFVVRKEKKFLEDILIYDKFLPSDLKEKIKKAVNTDGSTALDDIGCEKLLLRTARFDSFHQLFDYLGGDESPESRGPGLEPGSPASETGILAS